MERWWKGGGKVVERWCRNSLPILPLFHGSICLVSKISGVQKDMRKSWIAGCELDDVSPSISRFPIFLSMTGGCYISRLDYKFYVSVVEAVLPAINHRCPDDQEKDALDVLFPGHVLLIPSRTESKKMLIYVELKHILKC